MLEKLFKLRENGTDAKTEVMAGITTFMTMAYNDRYILDGVLRQLPVRTGTWNGTECILCLYCCSWNGL